MKRSFFILILSLTTLSFSNGQTAKNDLIEDLLTTWDKHVAMNALLLNGIENAYLTDKSASGGRNVGEQFAHIHNVRMMWLSGVVADQEKGMDDEVDAAESLKKDYLVNTLATSDKLLRTVLKEKLLEGAKIGEMSPIRFLVYLISHESHTRGQIILAMKQSDHSLPPQVTYGIWEW